jgi:hypothetical protein
MLLFFRCTITWLLAGSTGGGGEVWLVDAVYEGGASLLNWVLIRQDRMMYVLRHSHPHDDLELPQLLLKRFVAPSLCR